MTTEYLAERDSAISWGAVIFGGVAACAVTLFMLAVGLGIGFSIISPWSGEGVSATTFKITAGIFLVAMAIIAGGMGGFIAGRMRRSWASTDVNEIYFRDSAHGFLVWAFATLLGAAVLGGAATHIAAGAATGAAPAIAAGAQQPSIVDRYVDLLLRASVQTGTPLNPAAQADLGNTRAELGRLLFGVASRGTDVAPADRTYVAQLVSSRTGLSQAEAENRVNTVITQAKSAADETRKATAKSALWLAASMLAGALAAALAAVEGGVYRDSRWYEPGWRKGQGRILVSTSTER